jgi:hypothetical protein
MWWTLFSAALAADAQVNETRELMSQVSGIIAEQMAAPDIANGVAACMGRAHAANELLRRPLMDQDGEVDLTAMSRLTRGSAALLDYAEVQCRSPGLRSGTTTVSFIGTTDNSVAAEASPFKDRVDEADWSFSEQLAVGLMGLAELDQLGDCASGHAGKAAAWVEKLHDAGEDEKAADKARKKAQKFVEAGRKACGATG